MKECYCELVKHGISLPSKMLQFSIKTLGFKNKQTNE